MQQRPERSRDGARRFKTVCKQWAYPYQAERSSQFSSSVTLDTSAGTSRGRSFPSLFRRMQICPCCLQEAQPSRKFWNCGCVPSKCQ